jgi:hypothetical protein
MKRITRRMAISIALASLSVLLIIGVAFGFGSALPGSGWWTSYQIQNVGTVTGTLAMTAYDRLSVNTYSSPGFLYGAGGALIYNPGQPPNYNTGGTRIGFGDGTQQLPGGFQGSVVLSSDQPMVAVVNLGNNINGSVGVSGGQAGAFYDGSSAGASQLSFPTVKNNFFGQTSEFFIQAAGASSIVTMTYKMNDASVHSQVTTVGANQMFVFDPSAATPPVASSGCGATSATSPCFGAAVVVGSTPIAGAYVETGTGSPATFALATTGFTSSQADNNVMAPALKNAFFGGTTGWTIQNTTGVAATVFLTFTVTTIQGSPGVNPGDVRHQTIVVPANQSLVVNALSGNIGGIPPGVFFSGVASSAQKVVSTVSETNSGTGKAMYSAFGRSSVTNKLAFPLVKEFFFGSTTAVTIQNAGTTTTTVTVQYINGVTVNTQNPHAIGPGAAFIWNKVSDPANASKYPGGKPAAGTNNSVLVSATGPIIGLAQEAAITTPWSSGGVDVKNYEGFNLP